MEHVLVACNIACLCYSIYRLACKTSSVFTLLYSTQYLSTSVQSTMSSQQLWLYTACHICHEVEILCQFVLFAAKARTLNTTSERHFTLSDHGCLRQSALYRQCRLPLECAVSGPSKLKNSTIWYSRWGKRSLGGKWCFFMMHYTSTKEACPGRRKRRKQWSKESKPVSGTQADYDFPVTY